MTEFARTIDTGQQRASAPSNPRAAEVRRLSDAERTLQSHLLLGVSRTFALTIPQLPIQLRDIISNLYLLCRIVDTIEDEPALGVDEQAALCAQFVEVVETGNGAQAFSATLAARLSAHTIPAEQELIRRTPAVIAITFSFNPSQLKSLARCVRVMASGMVEFQHVKNPRGLEDLDQLARYCYHVAGIVGESLTELFCEYSPEIARHRQALMPLAVSFGQGLQMTNILKDIWDDQRRGACWLPRSVFDEAGFDLARLAPGAYRTEFGAGLERLIAIAQSHLDDAVTYTLLIPRHERGIRSFCLWAIGFAVLTLRKLARHPDFSTGREVKISRRSVKATILIARMSRKRDRLIRGMVNVAGRDLRGAESR